MKASIRFFICFVSAVLLLLPKKIAQACGFYVFPGEYRFWMLQPDLVNEQDITPFYFASTYLYRNDLHAGQESSTAQNINEWYDFIGKKASKADIHVFLNETDPQKFFDNIQVVAGKNGFVRYAKMLSDQSIYKYLCFSKKLEQISANTDPWDEYNFPQKNLTLLINDWKKLYSETKSPFLRLRIAYQLMRSYNYNLQTHLQHQVYDAWVEPVKSNSWIKTAALYEKAIQTPGYEQEYLLSKVFDQGNYNRRYCLLKFNRDALPQALTLAKNNHERSVLHAMKVFNYPGKALGEISKIYAYEPAYKELPFLLLREINKVEDWLLTNKVTGFPSPAVYSPNTWANYQYEINPAANYRNDVIYSNSLYRFVKKIIAEGKHKEKSLLTLYAAHLAMLNENHTAAATHLAELKKSAQLPLNLKTQLRINTLLLALENGFNAETEKALLSILQTPNNRLGIYDPAIMKDQLILYTARKLIKQGERVKGLMLLSRTNRALGEIPVGYKQLYQEIADVATTSDYDEMIKLLKKEKKTPFEVFVTRPEFGSPSNYWGNENGNNDAGNASWNANKLLDLKASHLIRDHELPGALAVMKLIPDSFYKSWPYESYIGGDPFYLNVYKSHRPTTADIRSLDKKQVISEIIRLEQLAKRDKLNAALCYYQLGNAWYNMSYYGKNWLIVRQWWSAVDLNQHPGFQQSRFYDDYFGTATAKSYYLKAAETSKDKHLAALAYFMANKCDTHFRDYTRCVQSKSRRSKSWEPKVAPTPGSKHIDTRLFNRIVSECETYLSFIKQYNRKV